jgi:hypothetical protein
MTRAGSQRHTKKDHSLPTITSKQNAIALSRHYLLLLRTSNPLKTEQCESTFCPMLPHIRNSNALFVGSQVSPAYPSDKICIKVEYGARVER